MLKLFENCTSVILPLATLKNVYVGSIRVLSSVLSQALEFVAFGELHQPKVRIAIAATLFKVQARHEKSVHEPVLEVELLRREPVFSGLCGVDCGMAEIDTFFVTHASTRLSSQPPPLPSR